MAVITEAALRAMRSAGLPNPFPLRRGDKLTPAAADYLKEHGIRLVEAQDAVEGRHPAQNRHIPVGVSGRHVHLSAEHAAALFGPGYSLTPMKELSQPGQFAAKEQVTLRGPRGAIHGVRILGPIRSETQVEIAKTDGFTLGVHPPIRLSGSIVGTPGITIEGPCGEIVLARGVIIARNHVHMSPEEAAEFGVAHGDTLILAAEGERKIEFADVAVRVDKRFRLDFHIDTDEANAADLRTGDVVRLVGANGIRFA